MSRQRTRVVRIAVLTSLVVLVGAWAPAHAQSPTSMHGPGARGDGGMMLQLLLRSANLTPEQDAKVREILTARRAASRPLIDQLRQAQRELADRMFAPGNLQEADRKSTRLNSSHDQISYAVFCLKKKKKKHNN